MSKQRNLIFEVGPPPLPLGFEADFFCISKRRLHLKKKLRPQKSKGKETATGQNDRLHIATKTGEENSRINNLQRCLPFNYNAPVLKDR